MLRWREHPAFTTDKITKVGNKALTGIYASFFVGLASRILEVRPSKFSLSGFEFTVTNINIVPGFFFLLVVFMSLGVVIYTFFFAFHWENRNRAFLRILIYRSARQDKIVRGRKIINRSLRGRSKQVKSLARAFYTLYAWFQIAFIFFPFAYVLCFEREAVKVAFGKLIN